MLNNRITRVATLITKYELWIAFFIAPFLLFPGSGSPIVCMCIYGVIWVSRKISTGHFSITTILDIPILLLVITLLIGYIISIDQQMSWVRMWNYLLGVIIFYSLANKIQADAHWQIIVILTSLITVAIVILSLVGTNWSSVRLIQIPWLYERFPALVRNLPGSGVPHESDLINARWIGITLGFILPFLLPFISFESSWKFRLILVITILLASMTLLITQSLQGLAGLIAGGIFIAICRNRKWSLIIPLGLLAGIGLIISLGAPNILVDLLSTTNPVGIAVALRLDMWSRAAAMLRDMPFTGIGVNIFSVVQSNFYPGYIIGPEPHAHNLFFQTALDQGIPGLCAMLLMFVAWGIIVKNNYESASSPGQKTLYIGLMAAILSYLTAGLVDGMTLGAKPAPLIWAFLGIGAAPGFTTKLEQKTSWAVKFTRLKVIAPLMVFGLTIASILILNPGAVYSNYGSILAQKSLYNIKPSVSLPVDQMQSAKSYLLKASELSPDDSSHYFALSRLDGWLGNAAPAADHLSKAVELDGKSPYLEYFPSEFMIRIIQPDNKTPTTWDDLIQIYSHWIDRFPNRAEGYLLCGLASAQGKHDLIGAITYIMKGLERKAEPQGILHSYLAHLQSSLPE